MPRYEEMEHLLNRVRERLGVVDPVDDDLPERRTTEPVSEQLFAQALDVLLALSRDAEQLTDLVRGSTTHALSQEQREDLLALLGRVTRDLWKCRSALESTPRPER